MLTISIVVSIIFYQRVSQHIEEKISGIAEKNLSQTVGLFELMLKGYDSVTKSLNSNNELMNLIQQSGSSDVLEKINLEKKITDLLGAIFYSRNDLVGIHVMTNDGYIYSFERIKGAKVQYAYDSEEYERISGLEGEINWLGVYPNSLMSDDYEGEIFAFGRQLFDLTNLKPVGIVLIESDALAIHSALVNASLSDGSFVEIHDQHGGSIMQVGATDFQHHSISSSSNAQQGRQTYDTAIGQFDHAQVFTYTASIPTANWTMFVHTPNEELKLELKEAQKLFITVIIVLVIVAVIISKVIARSFSSPFISLLHQMKQVELGNFRGQVEVNSYEELNVLVGSFNRMVIRIEELIELTRLSSISEKNAQLMALQSQVNPHFLFNTLDMIYWMLDERENDRLSNVILALSHMFRYNSDWNNASHSTLGQELEQLQHYLTIIETRLSDRIHAEINITEELLSVKLPKMILQPIVENAVKYGLEPLQKEGSLVITAKTCHYRLIISITDNGIGIEPKQLERIHQQLEKRPTEYETREGIGIKNVHDRLQLLYGDGYGVAIQSELNKGTVVYLTLPINKGEI